MSIEFGGNHLLAEACGIRLDNQVSVLLDKEGKKFGGIDLLILDAGTLGPVQLPEVSPVTNAVFSSFITI